MANTFTPQYDSLHDLRASIKAQFEIIDQSTSSLLTVSNHDEMAQLTTTISAALIESHMLIDNYSTQVDELENAINQMTSENHNDAEVESTHFNEQMKSTDSSGLPVDNVSLSCLRTEKERRYDLTLPFAAKRVASLSPTIKSPINGSIPSSSPSASPPSTDTPKEESSQSPSRANEQVIELLIDRITQLQSNQSSPSTNPNIALPPIKLETFDGSDITRWQSFKYQLDQLILNQAQFTEVQRAYYVRSCLKGAAFSLVASIPVQENFLAKIMSRLESEYGRDDLAQARLIQSLRSIRSKSSQVVDQLAAVQSMINVAHAIHGEWGVDALYVQQQVAECVHPRFISFISRHKPKTLLSALELIENELREALQDSLTTSAFTSHHQSTVNSPFNNGPKPQRTPPAIHQSPQSSAPTFNGKSPLKNPNPMCVFCGKHPFSGDCTQVTTIKARKEFLRKNSLCHCCFSNKHSTNDCKRSCRICKGKHHKSLCDQSPPHNHAAALTVTADSPIQVNTRLFTAPVVVANPDVDELTRAHVLLDTGAQVSLISRKLASRLQLASIGQLLVSITGITGADDTPASPSLHDIVNFDLVTIKGRETIRAVVRDTDSIIHSIQHRPLSTEDLAVVESTLKSIPNHFSESTIHPDLLLGVGDTLRLLEGSKSTTLPCGYRLIESVIGPLVAGSENLHASPSVSHDETPIHQPAPLTQVLRVASVVTAPEETLDQKVERIFAIDPIARVYETTEKESRKLANEMVTKHFNETIKHHDDGYYVQYAIKPETVTDLPDNHDLAVSRLASTVRKLSKDRNLLDYYDTVIKDQLALGQIELVDPADTSGVIHYLAHQAVLRPDKPSTPLRIVYDASAHLRDKPSLNDMIYQGPSDLEQIPALLLRARSRRCLIIADVEKAFLQVKLCPSQRNMLRFLWLKDLDKPVSQHNLLVLRFCVTPFGINQSPCILNKVINHHILNQSKDCDSHLIQQLVNNIYVDNIVINSDSPSTSIYSQSKQLFESMSMNLRDYASNDPSFASNIPEADHAKDPNQKLLGLIWDTSTDQLSIKIPVAKKLEKETKRSMLSTVASLYDPLGLLNPLLLPPRLTVQSLWNDCPNWSSVVDESTRVTFHNQMLDVENFSLPIDRFAHLSSANVITLVAFSDASKSAMAACVYHCVPEESPILLISKTRLAPLKSKSTIPKMELESLTMAHSLLQFTVETLRKEFPEKPIHIYSFSDSAVVLHWCKPDFNKPLGVFVSNRVKQIRAISEELASLQPLVYHSPRHVRSENNPADHATRGLSSVEMNDPTHQWWVGPPWLRSNPNDWPHTNLSDLQCPVAESFTFSANAVSATPPQLETVIELSRHSSLKKAINVTSLVYRFISRSAIRTGNPSILEQLKHIPVNSESPLNASEKRFAFNRLISLHQMQYVTDSQRNSMIVDESSGILRVDTRLTNAELPSNFKSPIYIPTSSESTLARLIIKDIHCSSSHASCDIILNSLKSKYFIPRARSLVKSTLNQCIPCRKTNNLPFRYPQSPSLPSDRVTRSLPFNHCGIDYAGPFHMNDNEKQWLVVFTCFSTRLTHIEVVASLLPSTFILAFRRFCSRRGTPSRVTSDKATTLRMASSLLSQPSSESSEVNTLLSSLGVTWHFTTAHSPWKGGVYERLIKIIKQSFARSIGSRKLSKDEFDTVTTEVEALLNSRPLTYVSSDEIQTFSGPVLRPIDIILPDSFLGCPLNLVNNEDEYKPPEEENSSREAAIRQLTRSITVVDSFWKRWHQEYLSSLRDASSKSDPLQSTRSSSIHPRRGSIVLVIDESGNTPRSSWKMAQILSLTETSATLRSHAGRVIERPINLLIPLEIHSEDIPVESFTPVSVNAHDAHPMITRSRARQEAPSRQ